MPTKTWACHPANDPDNGYKWCIGTNDQRQTNLRQAIINIMNSGIPITLIPDRWDLP